MKHTRRTFLGIGATIGMSGITGFPAWSSTLPQEVSSRRYHLSISIDALNADPELLDVVQQAGVQHLWLACFFQGQWHHTSEAYLEWRDKIRARGMHAHQITIPLGHPSFNEQPPDYMPDIDAAHWKPGVRPDGRVFWGVSLHPPGTQENVAALQEIATTDPGIVFLDDDFRLAPSPADIGGCFCEEHQQAFLKKHGFGEEDWAQLLQDVADRKLTPVVRTWVNDTCDELTASFRAQQAALGEGAVLGNMIMYLGSEKAGIRLSDYTGVPFRVGELMFNDESFAPVKGKTNELFSALFHRRFTPPDLAYSETTAWPPEGLSAQNMAAKLIISTIADVRNTMFMSGTTPFPRTHWETLAPAMREQAALHAELLGHHPRGPFKHFWGEHSRWVGDANPFSLFLACGVPFEVTEAPAEDGWTFLSEADARALRDGEIISAGTVFVCRDGEQVEHDSLIIPEELDALFAFKEQLQPALAEVPHVVESLPAVCAWYPTANRVLLWNLAYETVELTLRSGEDLQTLQLGPLKSAVLKV